MKRKKLLKKLHKEKIITSLRVIFHVVLELIADNSNHSFCRSQFNQHIAIQIIKLIIGEINH